MIFKKKLHHQTLQVVSFIQSSFIRVQFLLFWWTGFYLKILFHGQCPNHLQDWITIFVIKIFCWNFISMNIMYSLNKVMSLGSRFPRNPTNRMSSCCKTQKKVRDYGILFPGQWHRMWWSKYCVHCRLSTVALCVVSIIVST